MPQGSVAAIDQQEFSDADFRVVDNADQSKKLAFQVSGVTTATTRTLTVPNASTTIVGTDATQTLTNKSLVDASTTFVDDGDATKKLAFEVSGITTATTRTATWPDKDGTVAMTSDIVSGGMTLLGTLTTTSGTTQSLTDIASGYRLIMCEIDGVSFSSAVALTIATSSTNGAAYGTAGACTQALSSAARGFQGIVWIYNVSSTGQSQTASGFVSESTSGTDKSITSIPCATNTAAVVNAIRFAGGTFDAGTIRVYGVK